MMIFILIAGSYTPVCLIILGGKLGYSLLSIVWGIAMFGCLGFDSNQFGIEKFLAGAVTTAIPGIVIQIVLVPLVVIGLRRFVIAESKGE